MSEINWSQLAQQADNATKPASDGDHPVEIVKASWKLNSSGNPMFSVQARIIGGDEEGKTVFNNFNLTVGNNFALAIFFRHMNALGFDDAYFASLSGEGSQDKLCADLVGRRAIFTLSTRQWQGVDRNQVDNVKPLDESTALMMGVTSGGGSFTGSGVPTPASSSIPTPTPTIPVPTVPEPRTPFDI